MELIKSSLSIFVFIALFAYKANSETYIVQPGDTISKIAAAQLNKPINIYGPAGRISLILSFNPDLTNPDLIYPGQIIELTASENPLPKDIERHLSSELALEIPPQESQIPVGAPKISDKDLQFEFEISQFFSRLDATDRQTNGKATLISDALTLIHFHFNHALDLKNSIRTSVALRENKYQAPSTTQTLDSPPVTKKIQLMYMHQAHQRLNINASFGVEQRLFLRAVTATHYVLDIPSVPSSRLGLDYQYFQTEKKSAGVRLYHSWLHASPATGQSIQSGKEQEASLYCQQLKNNLRFEQRAFLIQSEQDSNIVSQKETLLGVSLGLSYSF